MEHGILPSTDHDLLISALVQAGEDTTYAPCACEACRAVNAERRARCRTLLRRLQGRHVGEGPPAHLVVFAADAPQPPRTQDDTVTLGYAVLGRLLTDNERLKAQVTSLQKRLGEQLEELRRATFDASVLFPRSPLGAPAWLDRLVDAVANEPEGALVEKIASRNGKLAMLAKVRSLLAPQATPHPGLRSWHIYAG